MKFKAQVYITGWGLNREDANFSLQFAKKEFKDNFGGYTSIAARGSASNYAEMDVIIVETAISITDIPKFTRMCRTIKDLSLQESLFTVLPFGIVRWV